MKARFLPEEVLSKMTFSGGDAPSNGYFSADDELKDGSSFCWHMFLNEERFCGDSVDVLDRPRYVRNSSLHVVSCVSCLAFGDMYSEKQCREIIYDFAEGGGDGVASLGNPVPRVESQAERCQPASSAANASTALARHIAKVRHCLSIKRDVMSTHYITTTMHAGARPAVVRSRSAGVFDTLLRCGHWRLLLRRGKMANHHVSVIPSRLHLSYVTPCVPVDLVEATLSEPSRVAAFADNEETMCETMNATTLLKCLHCICSLWCGAVRLNREAESASDVENRLD